MPILTLLKVRSTKKLKILNKVSFSRGPLLFFESLWVICYLFPLVWISLNKSIVDESKLIIISTAYYILFLAPSFYILWKNRVLIADSVKSSRY